MLWVFGQSFEFEGLLCQSLMNFTFLRVLVELRAQCTERWRKQGLVRIKPLLSESTAFRRAAKDPDDALLQTQRTVLAYALANLPQIRTYL